MKEGSGDDPFADDPATSEPEPETKSETAPPASETRENSVRSVPWIFARDNVKSDRSMVQFFLRDQAKDRESEFIDDLENRLGTTVSKTDAREAAYLAAMDNPELVADELREWGFDLKD